MKTIIDIIAIIAIAIAVAIKIRNDFKTLI